MYKSASLNESCLLPKRDDGGRWGWIFLTVPGDGLSVFPCRLLVFRNCPIQHSAQQPRTQAVAPATCHLGRAFPAKLKAAWITEHFLSSSRSSQAPADIFLPLLHHHHRPNTSQRTDERRHPLTRRYARPSRRAICLVDLIFHILPGPRSYRPPSWYVLHRCFPCFSSRSLANGTSLLPRDRAGRSTRKPLPTTK